MAFRCACVEFCGGFQVLFCPVSAPSDVYCLPAAANGDDNSNHIMISTHSDELFLVLLTGCDSDKLKCLR